MRVETHLKSETVEPDLCYFAVFRIASAAANIASTIFTYPVHRHRLPEIASLTSSSAGSEFSSNKALAERIIPSVQNPH